MKRIKSMHILILLMVILLTGCGNKLKCEIKTNNYTSKIVINYKDEKPTSYNFKDDMAFSADAPEAELYYHSKYEEYSTIISEKYASIRNSVDGVSMKIKYDFTKDKSQQENILLIQKNDTKKQAKSKLKSLGYKCK